jgi:sulfide:quinone oxidoreductase
MTKSGQVRVLIAGGGVAAIETLIALRRLAGERVELELLAPDSEFNYLPLSVAEPFGEDQLRVPLARIADDHGATLHADSLQAVDAPNHVVRTGSEAEIPYDVLVLAYGARRREAVDGAITFGGPDGRDRVRRLTSKLEAGQIGEVCFALPVGAGWPLAIYELALLTSARLAVRGQSWQQLTMVTPESEPLQVLGPGAVGAVRSLLTERGIGLITNASPKRFASGHLELAGGGRIAAEAVIALPALQGRAVEGLPLDADDFIMVTRSGHVLGTVDVYAAGDATTSPLKQGGLATQQADAIAAEIALRAGAPVMRPEGDPVLRAILLTGAEPRFIRAMVTEQGVLGSVVGRAPLWHPPSKVSSRYLSPYLAELGGIGLVEPEPRRELDDLEPAAAG